MAKFGEFWKVLGSFGEVLKNTTQTAPGLTLGRFWLGEEEVRPVCSYIIILQGEVRDATPLQSRSSLHCTGAPPSNGAGMQPSFRARCQMAELEKKDAACNRKKHAANIPGQNNC